jgi:hypothetical protein
MARARWFGGWATTAALLLTACGGDPEPTAAEKRAAASKWIQRVDAACTKANEAISGRGWPTDLVDLDRLVVRGAEDARAAIRTIVDTPLPEDDGPRHADFVRELKALEPELGKLSDASENLEPAALVEAAEAIKPRLAAAEKAAKEAGLRECLQNDERFFVPDAVRAPVFAEQLNKLDRSILRRLEKVGFDSADTTGEFAKAFARYSEVIDDAVKGIDRLDPPQWAADQTANYQIALRDLQSVSQQFTAMLVADKGKPREQLDRAKYLRAEKEVGRAATAEGKARKKMLRAVGAVPTGRTPDDGEATEPESEEQS